MEYNIENPMVRYTEIDWKTEEIKMTRYPDECGKK